MYIVGSIDNNEKTRDRLVHFSKLFKYLFSLNIFISGASNSHRVKIMGICDTHQIFEVYNLIRILKSNTHYLRCS